MHRLPYIFLVLAGGLSLATFATSQTLAEPGHQKAARAYSILGDDI